MKKLILFISLIFLTGMSSPPEVGYMEDWYPPTTRTDKTPFLREELSHYVVYFGDQPGIYPNAIIVNTCFYSIDPDSLKDKVVYFVVTAVDMQNRESPFSVEFVIHGGEYTATEKMYRYVYWLWCRTR